MEFIKIGLASFFIVYVIRTKDCPLGLCKKFREKLDFMPFNCFFCFSTWVTVSIFTISYFFPVYSAIFVNLFSSLGVTILIYLSAHNFFTKI
jgi:Protein of unknown function (DUF1360)